MTYNFNGTEGGPITLARATESITDYQQTYPQSVKARFFGKDAIQQLLNVPGSMGIRMYFGIDPVTKQNEIILIAADADGNDIAGLIMDLSQPCPNVCPSISPFNTISINPLRS